LQAELGKDPVDTAHTDCETSLAQLLSDDFGGCIRIEKAMADNLADDFVGTAIVGLGASRLTDQARSPFLQESCPELEISLAAEAKLPSGGKGSLSAAFPLNEHGEFEGNFIVLLDGQVTPGPVKDSRSIIKLMRLLLDKG
jgi:hypothetical protein